jgi:S-(hydroxymethyl)glutathione dehydrogenase/alcohol dehydrogenase
MKAALFQKAHSPLTVEDLEIGEPQADEVLVRTVCSGVCHSDAHFLDGLWRVPMPTVLGHEASGVVERVGSDVTYVEPGDRVIMSFKPFCGQCYYCIRGEGHLCNDAGIAARAAGRLSWKGSPVLQMANVGSFAEQMITTESGVVKIPEEMPMAEAALIGCGVMTGVGAALYTAKVPGGAITAVVGCGGIGLNVIQGCSIAGASRIIAVDVVPEKLEMARGFGATDRQRGRCASGLRHDALRRHGRHRGNDAAGLRDPRAGTRLSGGEEDDRLHVRQHALSPAHAAAGRSLPAGASQSLGPRERAHAPGGREPRLRAHEDRQGRPLRPRDFLSPRHPTDLEMR